MRISQHPSPELLRIENWQFISQKLICLHTEEKYSRWCGRGSFKYFRMKHRDMWSVAHQRKYFKFLARSLVPNIQIQKIQKHQRHEILYLRFRGITIHCSSCLCPQASLVLIILTYKLSSILWSCIFEARQAVKVWGLSACRTKWLYIPMWLLCETCFLLPHK